MKKAICKKGASASGFSIVELIVVLGVIAILSAISIPYFYSYSKRYKSEDQAIKIMDLMREAGQLAITRRRTMRVEIDLTDNAFLIIDQNGSPAGTLVKRIPLERTQDVRVDVQPTGVTRPNPPNYTDITFTTDTVGHQAGGTTVIGNNVWQCRFLRDGSVVNMAATPVPVNATIYVWPPVSFGSTTPRNLNEVRAITFFGGSGVFGGSGALRYWKHNGTTFVPSQ